MKFFYSLIFVLLVFVQCEANSNSNNFSQQYNLNFEHLSGDMFDWTFYLNQCYVKIDSSVVCKNKHPLKIYSGRNQSALNGNFYNRILLPNVFYDNIDIRINSKSKNINNAKLLVDRISKDEKIFHTDTITINVGDTLWNTTFYRLPALGMKFVGFRILIHGVSKKEMAFWLDRLTISLDNKPIDDFSLPVIHSFSVSHPEKIKKLSLKENLYEDIEDLKEKKIIALGETVHGSGSINMLTSQIIKHQVLKNECKLVLLEFPFEIMMFLNKEIQGETIFKGDSILKSYKPLFDYAILDDLIMWLTQYNKENPNNAVSLMGIDINLTESSNLQLLSDYITCLNYTINNKTLIDFSELLSKKFLESETALAYLKEHHEIKNTLDPLDYLLIKHNLEMSSKGTPSVYLRLDYRDLIMKDNVAFSINLFAPENKTVTIWTHFNHANYARAYPGLPIRSFGSYMKDLYGEEYSCLAMSVGNGNVTTVINGKATYKKVLSPVKGSIEYYLNTTLEEYVYCNSSNFDDTLSYIRVIGQPYLEKKQFMLINPKTRMNGIIFIKNSEPSN